MPRLLVLLLVSLTGLPFVGSGEHVLKTERASAGPRVVLIIRHGEKPEGKDPHLSKRGYERAEALARVIPEHFPKPDFLFATQASAGSVRPIETITPLSKTLHEEIDESFKNDAVSELAHKILIDPKYEGQVVLIAWHHGKIPALAHALGASEAPGEWESNVFDRVWEIRFHKDKVEFRNLPQRALSGDAEK